MAKLTVTGSRLGRLADEGAEPAESALSAYADNQLLHVPVARIRPNPEQPRATFAEEALRELADSIRQRGVLQPVIVTPDPEESEHFILVVGERRWRASQLAGLETIPTIFKRDVDLLELAIIENLQRENLNPVEEAEGLQRLKERHDYTDVRLAQVLGKSRVAVTELLALTRLPEAIKEECRALDINSKIALLQLSRAGDPQERASLWDAIKAGVSTRGIDRMRKRRNLPATGAKPKRVFRTDFDATVVVQSATDEGLFRERVIAALHQALHIAEGDEGNR